MLTCGARSLRSLQSSNAFPVRGPRAPRRSARCLLRCDVRGRLTEAGRRGRRGTEVGRRDRPVPGPIREQTRAASGKFKTSFRAPWAARGACSSPGSRPRARAVPRRGTEGTAGWFSARSSWHFPRGEQAPAPSPGGASGRRGG